MARLGSPAVSRLGKFSTFVSRDSRTMLTDQAVLDRFVDDYPTELLPTEAQRGWLMRVKAAHHGSKPCATACETVNWEFATGSDRLVLGTLSLLIIPYPPIRVEREDVERRPD